MSHRKWDSISEICPIPTFAYFQRGPRCYCSAPLLKRSLPLLVLFLMVAAIAVAEEKKQASETSSAKVSAKKDPYAWKPLFDGKTLKGWKTPNFYSDGKVSVADGCIILGEGNGITGIKFDGKPPRTNYEIEFQAKRLKGEDFFGVGYDPSRKRSIVR